MSTFGRAPLRKLSQFSLDEQLSYIIHWYGTRYLKFKYFPVLYSHLSPFMVP